MRSLYSGVAGLRNHQTKMDVIGDNISNVNTVGFKKSTVTFQDLLVQTLRGASAPQNGRGGINAMQVGLGVGLGSISVVNTQGNLQNTGKTTDLAIDGDGFFIVGEGADRAYTRTGTLDIDTEGNLIMASNGMKVMGWQADIKTGLINNTGAINPLNIPIGTSIAANPTTKAVYTKNLDSTTPSNTPVNTSVIVYDSLGAAHSIDVKFVRPTGQVNIANAKFSTTPTATKTYTITDVYDDNGNSHEVKVAITKDAAAVPETWSMSYQIDNGPASAPVSHVAGDYSGAGINITNGTNLNFNLKFNDLDATGTEFADGDSTSIYGIPNEWRYLVSSTDVSIDPASFATIGAKKLVFKDDGSYDPANSDPLQFTLSYVIPSGAANQNVTLDLTKLTQYAGTENQKATTITGNTDGYTSGSLQSIALDSNGVITASFSNGLTQALGQLALAVFNNPGGLIRQGGSLYKVSNNSGDPQIGTSGNGGRGKIAPGALEMANVDLAQEFTDMIVTQRGFQANSKIISTTDEMLNELANLKR